MFQILWPYLNKLVIKVIMIKRMLNMLPLSLICNNYDLKIKFLAP